MELKVKLQSKDEAQSTEESWKPYGVLHLALNDDGNFISSKKYEQELQEINEDLKFQIYSSLSGKAEYYLFVTTPNVDDLAKVRKIFSTNIVDSFFSLTEISEYTSTQEDEHNRLVKDGVEGEELAEKLDVFRKRMRHYKKHKINPGIPEKKYFSFYPMSKKRDSQENWFLLPFDKRKELMHEHGKLGREFAGRIVQLITTSTGFENWEWGVTLFTDDPLNIKDIVYQMRFDEGSAKYGVFGDFWLGVIDD